jgi:hypothetical protein
MKFGSVQSLNGAVNLTPLEVFCFRFVEFHETEMGMRDAESDREDAAPTPTWNP